MQVGGNFILHEQIPVASSKKKTKGDAQPMQAIHIDEHLYNVRRDSPWDAKSNAGPVCAFSKPPGTDCWVSDPLMPYPPASRRVFRYDTAGHGLSDFAGEML